MGTLFRPSLFVALGSLALVFVPGAAQAVVTVNIGGTSYDVTYFEGSYNDNIAKFQTPPLGQMP